MANVNKKMGAMIPKGVATLLPEAARERRRIETLLLDVMARWGYDEIVTPTFEYLDVLHHGLGEGLAEKAIKFVDRATGRMVVLRPDITPQVARIVSMLLSDGPRPLRLSYSAHVFRHEEEHAGREQEIAQIGGELIGLSGADADAEIIALASECLIALGFDNFQIALGQVEFVRSILGDRGAPDTRGNWKTGSGAGPGSPRPLWSRGGLLARREDCGGNEGQSRLGAS
jgi:ATP phosphoribosyltransferase regulatory subunit